VRHDSNAPGPVLQVANHPDLVTAAFEKDNLEYPPAAQLIADCGKMALLDRMLTKLHAGGHKVRRNFLNMQFIEPMAARLVA